MFFPAGGRRGGTSPTCLAQGNWIRQALTALGREAVGLQELRAVPSRRRAEQQAPVPQPQDMDSPTAGGLRRRPESQMRAAAQPPR